MADPRSRVRLIYSAGDSASSLTGSTHHSPLDARILTLTVISDRSCTMALQVLSDKAAIGDADVWTTIQSETITGGTADSFVYNGNFGATRVVLTAVGSSAWNAEVYGQAS